MITLDTLNTATPDDFVAALDGVFEHAPWVARAACARRPFSTVGALHEALMDQVRLADVETQCRFLRGHPALSAAAVEPGLTASSTAEQAALGLSAIGADSARFAEMSASYGARCGFPFIICARRHTPSSVLTALELRLGAPVAAERLAALAEIFFITRLRVVARVTGPGIPRTTGHLSTQVLTVNRTRPAPSMRVELLRDGKPIIDCIVAGDSEYRLIWEEPLRIGQHELRFYLGKCFANQFPPTPGAPACNVVAINFVVTEPEGHYHLPLLVPY